MNMKPAGSLPGCDDASKIIKGISGTIIGCRRQLSYPIFVVQHFYSADYTDCADYADCADGHAANYILTVLSVPSMHTMVNMLIVMTVPAILP